MTTTPEEKKKLFECPWCHNSCDSTGFSSDEPGEKPCCPVCGEPLEEVEADASGESAETKRTFQDEEVLDFWNSSTGWD